MFPVQDSDLVPPQLPPKGIRRRQPISKVKNVIITLRLIYKSSMFTPDESLMIDEGALFALRNMQNVSAPA